MLDKEILRILSTEKIRDQHHFLTKLHSLGFRINQSTLSRHLRSLQVRKVDGYYAIKAERESKDMILLRVVKVPPNLLVLNTLPGHAQALGYKLDSSGIEGIAGTVCGDDTLFLAVNSSNIEDVCSEIERIFGLRP